MELVFLGTGAGIPSKQRNVSALALQLLAERGTTWLFDCGEATQHQILHTSVKLGKVDKIFITHLHGDHIFGLPGLLGSRSFQGGDTPLTLYGPAGLKRYVEMSLSVSKTHLKYPLIFKEIDDGGRIFEDDQFYVEADWLDHVLPCLGYRIVEKDQPGRLLVEKLKEKGVKPGPVYQKLKAGDSVTLPDGQVLNGEDFIGPPKRGRKLAVLGDTRRCETARSLAADVDVLVHEATFSHEEAQLAKEYYHATTTEAASIAREAGAKRLILNHISSRYQDDSKERLLQEAKSTFDQTELADDLSIFSVERDTRD